ncbi:MAG: transposase [Rhodanobacter sp.]
MRKRYHSPELRRDAVRQVIQYRQPIRDVAKQYDLPLDTVRVWVRRHRESGVAISANDSINLSGTARTPQHDQLRRMIEMHLLNEVG